MRYMKTYTWILQDVGTSFLHCAIFKHLAKNGIIIPPVKSFLLYAMSCVKNLNLGGLYALQEMPRWRWLQNQKSNQNTETINPDNILRQEILLFYLLPTLPTPPFSLCFTFTSPPKKTHTFPWLQQKPPPGPWYPWWVRGTTETGSAAPWPRLQPSAPNQTKPSSAAWLAPTVPFWASCWLEVRCPFSVSVAKSCQHKLGCGLVEVESFTTPIKFGDSLDKLGWGWKVHQLFLMKWIFAPFHKQNLSQAFCANPPQPGEQYSRPLWHCCTRWLSCLGKNCDGSNMAHKSVRGGVNPG